MKPKQILAKIFYKVNQQITSKEFLNEHRIKNSFTRSRKLSFSGLIYYILQTRHKSLSINYAQFIQSFSREKLPFVSKQAISKSRQGISHKVFESLFRICVETYYQNFKKFRLWNGFHIYAVDGSTIQIPESHENIKVFGGNANQSSKLTPLASVSMLYDVMNDILIDVTLNPYRYNERISAKEHMKYMLNFQNSIVLFDRGYPSEELFNYLNHQGIYFLMRIPKTFKKLIFYENDSIFTYHTGHLEKELTLRCIHFTLENGSEEYLVTNIPSQRLKTSKFIDLYKLRWGIESKYRELKNRLEIENWGSLKPIGIKQEFFCAMFISNITAIVKQASDSMISKNTDNKYSYQSNRSYILNRIKCNIVFLLMASTRTCENFCNKLFDEACICISIIRPGRKFGRYRRNDRRKFYSNSKSCI